MQQASAASTSRCVVVFAESVPHAVVSAWGLREWREPTLMEAVTAGARDLRACSRPIRRFPPIDGYLRSIQSP